MGVIKYYTSKFSESKENFGKEGGKIDIGWIAICSIAIAYVLYKFWKRKQEFYLLIAIAIYLSLFHVGAYKLIQHFEEPIASKINSFSLFLLVSVFLRHLEISYKGMKK